MAAWVAAGALVVVPAVRLFASRWLIKFSADWWLWVIPGPFSFPCLQGVWVQASRRLIVRLSDSSCVREKDFLGKVAKEAHFREGKLVCKEEFVCCLVILDAESGVKIGVEMPDDMFLIHVKLSHSVGESPGDGCNVCTPQTEMTLRNPEAGSAYRLSPQSPVSKDTQVKLWGITTHIQAKGSMFPWKLVYIHHEKIMWSVAVHSITGLEKVHVQKCGMSMCSGCAWFMTPSKHPKHD